MTVSGRSAADQRRLDQALRAAVRIADWLSEVGEAAEARDRTGELIHALEQAGADDR